MRFRIICNFFIVLLLFWISEKIEDFPCFREHKKFIPFLYQSLTNDVSFKIMGNFSICFLSVKFQLNICNNVQIYNKIKYNKIKNNFMCKNKPKLKLLHYICFSCLYYDLLASMISYQSLNQSLNIDTFLWSLVQKYVFKRFLHIITISLHKNYMCKGEIEFVSSYSNIN